MCVEYYYQLADGDPAWALINAIQFGDWKAFTVLLSVQKNVNATDREGDWTPLMCAVHEESIEMVKALVKAGADVNYRGVFDPDEFALSLAAYTGDKKIFYYLEPLTSPELQKIARDILKENKLW